MRINVTVVFVCSLSDYFRKRTLSFTGFLVFFQSTHSQNRICLHSLVEFRAGMHVIAMGSSYDAVVSLLMI